MKERERHFLAIGARHNAFADPSAIKRSIFFFGPGLLTEEVK